jgi:cystathionine beta-lyase
MAARHGLRPEAGELLFTPGVVSGLALAIRALSSPGDGVIIQPPVYHPFARLVEANGRRVIENPLLERDGHWSMDLEGLGRAAATGARMLILCSPHNPVGRVWRREELEPLARACAEHRIILVSDEIHADLVLPGHRHLPTASLDALARENLVAFYAPSKTWNIAGLQTSVAFVPGSGLRARLKAEMDALGLGTPSVFGGIAAEAAYRTGGPWLEAFLEHVSANASRLREGLAAVLPEARVASLEGTYLAFVDLRGALARRAARKGDCSPGDLPGRLLLERTGLWLEEGARFGKGGAGWARLNLACDRATLDDAIGRMAEALG